MESKVSEFPKGLVLGKDGNIHIRLTRFIPLGDVGCYNPPPLGARRPRRHTSGQGLALIPNCHILWVKYHGIALARTRLTSKFRWNPKPVSSQKASTILSVLSPDHALTILFLGTHIRTSQWVTHHGIALARTRLTSKFRWNPKPVSSQNASC
ncbi:unnamed protein product [Malus baccata var. baccata]